MQSLNAHHWIRRLTGWLRGNTAAADRPAGAGRQRGFILLEVVVALGITASAGAATFSMVSVSSVGSRSTLDRTNASWMATSQAEEIRVATFVPTPGSYPSISVPAGFAVSNTTSAFVGGDDAIQNVLITVTRDGRSVLTLEMVKVDR